MSNVDTSPPIGALTAPQFAVPIEDSSQVAEARRQATRVMHQLGFDEQGRAKAELALTEAATNILKHAGHGHLLLRPLRRGGSEGLEILAIDSGPGIANVQAAHAAGYSTTGSLGAGMSAFGRLAAACDIYSEPQQGTVLRLEFWASAASALRGGPELGVVCLPKAGETECGDTWAISRRGQALLVMVVDGLGHGADAATAARMAVEVLVNARDLAPGTLLANVHQGIGSTRGAAVGLTLLEPERSVATFAGVGNVTARIATNGEGVRHLISRGGIAGHNMGAVREMTAAFSPGAMLLMHSDGLASNWDLANYPGLTAHHPAVIAGVLWRDHRRTRDDVTVLVVSGDTGAG